MLCFYYNTKKAPRKDQSQARSSSEEPVAAEPGPSGGFSFAPKGHPKRGPGFGKSQEVLERLRGLLRGWGP